MPPLRDNIPPRSLALLPATLALVLWFASVFGHDLGTTLTRAFFTWASTPGHLHPDGGQAGFARAEALIAALLISLALLVVGLLVWHLRHTGRRPLLAAALPWALWAVGVYLTWKVYIVFSSELVHFAQYALIGTLVHRALDRGRRPQAAFLLATAMGLLDEAWQHYGLQRWLLENHNHWFDWSDIVLNMLGAAGGILPWSTRARLLEITLRPDPILLRRTLLAAGGILLPLLLLDPVILSRLFGHYPHYPFWKEFTNLKPVHWPAPQEGIPLCLAALLLLGTLLDPRRTPLSWKGVLALLLLLAMVIRPPVRLGQPLHEVVPYAQIPWISRASTPQQNLPALNIDGRLDETQWQQAVRLGPFVNTVDGTASIPPMRPDDPRRPLAATHARLLWDDIFLYIAFEVEDRDMWSRIVARDTRGLVSDEGIQLLIDDGGDEIYYYSFGITPANVLFDQFVYTPTAPADYNPWNGWTGLRSWDGKNLHSAVFAEGTVDSVAGWAPTPTMDQDQGYSVELAIPWTVFETTTTPGFAARRKTLQPQPGERWRLGLYRVEFPRAILDTTTTQPVLSAEEARRHLRVTPEKFAEMLANLTLRSEPPGSGLFPMFFVVQAEARQYLERQAWSPTYNTAFHRPARFGLIEFVRD